MSNYVNREDIDRLINMVNEIDIALKKQGVNNISELLSHYYDQSEIDVPLNKLNTDLSELSNSLSELNDAIEDLDEDSGALSTDLAQLKAKLKTSQGQLEVLNVDLGALSSTLDQLDEDLDGLGANLTTLDNQLNGKGGLSEKLETLDEQLTDIENTDIATIKQTIGDTTGLIGSIASNIAATNTSIGDVKTDLWGNGGSASNYKPNSVKANLSNVKTTVGDSNSGLVKQLNDVDDIIGDEDTQGTVLGDIKTVQDDLGDVSQLSGTVADNIDTIQTSTIPAVKKKIGYSSIGNVDLQTQITDIVTQNTSITSNLLVLFNPSTDITEIYYGINIENPSIPSELSQLETLGYDTSTINYAVILNEHTTELYQKRSGGAWIKVSSFPEFTTAIGITYRFVEQRNTTPWLPFSYIYSVSTQQYFELSE